MEVSKQRSSSLLFSRRLDQTFSQVVTNSSFIGNARDCSACLFESQLGEYLLANTRKLQQPNVPFSLLPQHRMRHGPHYTLDSIYCQQHLLSFDRSNSEAYLSHP